MINKNPWTMAGLLLALAALLVTDAAGQDSPQPVTTVEGISEYRLENGLKVLLMPDASRPTVTANITYFVGSKHESYGESGMAHLLEHLLFYGTDEHRDIKREISERGGSANGTTWYERTNYFQTLPAGEENLDWILSMEADRMVNARLDEADLATEMTVVRNEFEIGESSPQRVLWQRVAAAAYEWHGYGRSTIGARSDIENVPMDRLRDFYERYYQPDNAMLIVSGNFEPDDALARISEHFGTIPAPERDLDHRLWPTYTREPVQDGPREVTVRRSGNVPAVMAAFHVPAATHADYAPLEALAHVLGDSPSGRLHKALVDSGRASSVGAFLMPLPEPGLLMLYASVAEDGDPDAVRGGMLAEVERLAEAPPTEEETARAVAALTSRMERTLDDSNRVGIGLSEWAAAGDWRLIFLHRDRLEEVTTEQVRSVAARYLVRDNRTVGLFVPEDAPRRAEIPAAPDPEALLADYAGREDRAAGESFAPTPENIEQRVERFTLANGTEVALLPRATRGNRVRGVIQMRVGTEETLTGTGEIPGFTAALLDKGTESMDRQAIRDRLDALGSSVGIGGDMVVQASIESRREQLTDVVDLVADMYRNSVFPKPEVEEVRNRRLTGLGQQAEDPGSVASLALSRHFNQWPDDHPHYVPDLEQSRARVRAVERGDLEEFHRQHYGFGPASTIAFVGDFDAEALRAQLEARFGTWDSPSGFQRINRPYREVEPVVIRKSLDDKANAMLIAQQALPIRDDHPDYPALQLAGHLLGGGFGDSRLGKRIRDDEGLSYAVGANVNAHAIDELGRFFASAAFNPDNRERLVAVLREELETVVSQGFTREELDSGRTGLLQQMRLQRSDDGNLASILAAGLYFDRDLFHQAEHERRIEQLTLEEVNAAVRRWLDPDALSIAMAGEFKE